MPSTHEDSVRCSHCAEELRVLFARFGGLHNVHINLMYVQTNKQTANSLVTFRKLIVVAFSCVEKGKQS
jgi:hypothetical protein